MFYTYIHIYVYHTHIARTHTQIYHISQSPDYDIFTFVILFNIRSIVRPKYLQSKRIVLYKI